MVVCGGAEVGWAELAVAPLGTPRSLALDEVGWQSANHHKGLPQLCDYWVRHRTGSVCSCDFANNNAQFFNLVGSHRIDPL